MQVAGAEMLVMETIRHLGSRITPTVFCLDAVGPLGEQLRASGIPVVCFDRRPGLDWRIFRRMAAEIRARSIDVIHAHQYTPFFYASIARQLSRRRPRLVFTEHGRHYPDVVSSRRKFLNRLVFTHLAHDITAVCQWSADALAATDGFQGNRIRVIPNGVDLRRYARHADRAALRPRLGLALDRRYIAIVARFHPVKDHSTLLRAFARIAPVYADVDLLLVGDGPDRRSIERQIAEAGLMDRVKLVGVQSNVPDWLLAADIFTLTSVSEAASITLLEAMACGLPSVITDVGGNGEIVRDGIDGLLVPRGDAVRLGEAFSRLLDDHRLCADMGRSASERVAQGFALDQTIECYASLYERGGLSPDAHSDHR